MNIAVGPFAIAATLLIVGGSAKAVRPGDTARALRIIGLPASAWLVRLGGGFEAVLGAWALATADRAPAVLLASSYAGFLAFVAAARSRGTPIASCGCFGRLDSPPSVVHLVINGLAVVVAGAVSIEPGDGFRSVVESQPLLGIPYVVLVIVGAASAMLALTVLPRALGSMRDAEG